MPAEDCVSVRKAPESIDDDLVRDRIACPVLLAQASDEFDRKCLVLAILAMLERQVQKQALLLFHVDVEALPDGGSGKPAREGISREGTRRAAEQITRELIQDNHGGQQ